MYIIDLSIVIQLYCIRTLNRYSQINYMDQCITKQVLHVYIMDTCSILCCTNTNSPISQFNSPRHEFTSVWSMVPYNIYSVHECLVNVPIQYIQCTRVSGQCFHTIYTVYFVNDSDGVQLYLQMFFVFPFKQIYIYFVFSLNCEFYNCLWCFSCSEYIFIR